MKRIIVVFTVLLIVLPLFSFDLFSEQQGSRTISFELDTALGLYQDKQYLRQAELDFSVEQNEESYRALAAVLYDSQTNRLEAKELSISLFMGSMTFKGGYFTHPWGSASTSHVVDVLQGRDLRKGFIDDLEAMKRPTFMALFSSYWEKSSLELLFKPGFSPSYLPVEGRYSLAPTAFTGATITEMDTHSLSAWEGGGRYRLSLGKLDAALLYFNGYQYDPGFAITNPGPPLSVDLIYTRYQLFGLEGSLLLDPFTLAVEGGFFLSEDADASDGSLYNSKFAYLAELSYTHPASSVFAAVAYQGKYVLDFSTLNPVDVDYIASFDGKAYDNTLIFVVEYPMLQQKLTARAAFTYQMESEGYALLGSLTYALEDNLSVLLKGTVYGALGTKASIYKSWDANDSVSVGMKAWF